MWTVDHENLLQKWGNKAQYYRILYERSSDLYKNRDRWFGVPLILLGTITTSSLFIQMDECDVVARTASGICALLFTLMSAVSNFVGYKELTATLLSTSQLYDEVVMDIQDQSSSSYLFTRSRSPFQRPRYKRNAQFE